MSRRNPINDNDSRLRTKGEESIIGTEEAKSVPLKIYKSYFWNLYNGKSELFWNKPNLLKKLNITNSKIEVPILIEAKCRLLRLQRRKISGKLLPKY